MTRLTTAHRIDLRERLRTDTATDLAMYFVAVLAVEVEANRNHDHWHPEIAEPLQLMQAALQSALSEAGVEFDLQTATADRWKEL